MSGSIERWHNDGRYLVAWFLACLVQDSDVLVFFWFGMAVALMVSLNQLIDPLDGTTQNYSAQDWCDLWAAGLWVPAVPEGMTVRSLSPLEDDWVGQAGRVGLVSMNRDEAIGFMVAVRVDELGELLQDGEFDWFLRSNDVWSRPPQRLAAVMTMAPLEILKCDRLGQMPSLVPDFAHSLSASEYKTVMRGLNRQFYRIGWTLPQYCWWVVETFGKMSCDLSAAELERAIGLLQQIPDVDDE